MKNKKRSPANEYDKVRTLFRKGCALCWYHVLSISSDRGCSRARKPPMWQAHGLATRAFRAGA